MSGLPDMVYSDRIQKKITQQFAGYNHNLYAGDGQIWDMQNLTSDYYPLLAPRKPRHYIEDLTTPNGLYGRDGLYWIDGTKFFAGGTEKGTVADNYKTITNLGGKIIILPDKKYYDTETDTFGSLEASWSGAAKIQDGTYVGEAAQANTIYADGVNWTDYFKEGDAVTVSGAAAHPGNNKTIIIREINGSYLRFYENSFEISEGGDSETLSIARTVPDMDFICENENRLWGCKDDTIYASKLGDPFNWNVYDGLATDSYAVGVGSAGDFTACTSYLGYPIFFKEDVIYKVYGDKPSNYQVMSSASLGVEHGSSRSIAVAGETLFYLSKAGIMAYSGGIPQAIGSAFGTVRYKNAVGGSDGRKYYVSMQASDGSYSVFVYDTWTNLWHREDSLQILDFGYDREMYFMSADGKIWITPNAREIPYGAVSEGTIESIAEFGDFVENDPNVKGISKLQLRIEIDANSSVEIQIKYDSKDEWQTVKRLTAETKRSYYLPVIPRRNDHLRLKLIGTGTWRLYSLVRESYSGSELKTY